MSWLKWIAAFAALVVMVYACALPGDLAVGRDADGGLAGIYTVNGVDPVGTEYSGTLTLVATDDPRTFDVQWLVTGARQEGTGTVAGQILRVTWSVVDSAGSGGGAGEGTGPIEYLVADDGSMIGTWNLDGFDQPGTEEVFPDP